MRKRTALLLGVLGILLIAAPVVVYGQDGGAPVPSYRIGWWVIGGGGGASQSSGYKLNGTIGQGIAGEMQSSGYRLKGGFWAGFPSAAAGPTLTPTLGPTVSGPYKAYLPLILKSVIP